MAETPNTAAAPNTAALAAALIAEIAGEISRYRDLEWQITAYTGGVQIWVISQLLDKKLLTAEAGSAATLLWRGAILSIGAFALFALFYVHRRLNQARERRGQVWELARSTLQGELSESMNTTLSKVMPGRAGPAPRFFEGIGVVFILSFVGFVGSLTAYALYITYDR